MNWFRRSLVIAAGLLLAWLPCVTEGKGKKDAWKQRNAAVVKQYDLKTRDRDIPHTDVELALTPGQTYESSDLPEIKIAKGVSASVAWGEGALLEVLEMEPGTRYPLQKLKEELITVVEAGSAMCKVGRKKLALTKDAVLYLTPGMKRTLMAGPNGFKALEIFSPVRLDHLKLAGMDLPKGSKVSFPDQGVEPSIKAGHVYDLNDVQWTPLTKPDANLSHKQSSANARLVWGRNAMLSFVRMDPNSSFPLHIHPEDQLMITLRGALVEGIMDYAYAMNGEKRHIILQPGGMAHSAKLSEFGAEALDVFYPVRPDYIANAKRQNDLYHEVIEPGTKPEKLAEGFTFAEGGAWIDGTLYFSDMYFADHRNGDWTGSPQQSRTIQMDPSGEWKIFASGMQTNGTIATPNSTLMVCDMFGHRVIEMDPNTGKIVRTVLDEVNGKPIDGPNDLVMDAKGGVYVSDPQFTPEPEKSQPGKQVYYVAPDGTAKVVIEPGEYAMPNGVSLSPDGKTFYVDNTWFAPGKNFVWAYDVQDDGSLVNKRQFAKLNLTPETLDSEDPAQRFDSRADGMAVDTDGRIYVTSLSGIQVFNHAGVYVGTIWCPQSPANCAFGGPDNNLLYMVGESSAWVIETKVTGLRYPRR